MITKQELLTFVQEIPEEFFDPHDEDMSKLRLARVFCGYCANMVVVKGIRLDDISRAGYDVHGMTMQTLFALADTILSNVSLRHHYTEVFIRALEDLEDVQKKQKEKDSV